MKRCVTTSFMAVQRFLSGRCKTGMKGGDSLFVCGCTCRCICQAEKKREIMKEKKHSHEARALNNKVAMCVQAL